MIKIIINFHAIFKMRKYILKLFLPIQNQKLAELTCSFWVRPYDNYSKHYSFTVFYLFILPIGWFIYSEFSNPSYPVYSNLPFIRHSRISYCYITMCEYLHMGNNTQEYVNLCRYFYYSCSQNWHSMPWKYYNDIMLFVYVV